MVETRDAAAPEDVARLLGPRLVVLTGAGMSTDSGIPDYRGPGKPVRLPMTFQEFTATPEAGQRYWARAHVGWSRIGTARPNEGHRALAALEAVGRLRLLITQNVDGLHEAAGSRHVVALHGRISDVVCLGCRRVCSRADVQRQLGADNPGWLAAHHEAAVRPDGDVHLDDTDGFTVPACTACGGRLKPDVVFFGENVPQDRVRCCYDALDAADGLLVAGSSLTVMSGLRFVRYAAKAGLPVVILNRGATRGDDLATVKVEAGCSEWLVALSRSRRGEALRPS